MLNGGSIRIDDTICDRITFENLEQYDENGIIRLTMNGGQRVVVAFDLDCEIDASCLPSEARSLAGELGRLFVGHAMGVEGLPRPLERTIGKIPPQLHVRGQNAHRFRQTLGLIGPEIDRGRPPDFT